MTKPNSSRKFKDKEQGRPQRAETRVDDARQRVPHRADPRLNLSFRLHYAHGLHCRRRKSGGRLRDIVAPAWVL